MCAATLRTCAVNSEKNSILRSGVVLSGAATLSTETCTCSLTPGGEPMQSAVALRMISVGGEVRRGGTWAGGGPRGLRWRRLSRPRRHFTEMLPLLAPMALVSATSSSSTEVEAAGGGAGSTLGGVLTSSGSRSVDAAPDNCRVTIARRPWANLHAALPTAPAVIRLKHNSKMIFFFKFDLNNTRIVQKCLTAREHSTILCLTTQDRI